MLDRAPASQLKASTAMDFGATFFNMSLLMERDLLTLLLGVLWPGWVTKV